MTAQDPRLALMQQPVDEPLTAENSEAIGHALRHPSDEVLVGLDAYIIGQLLDRSRAV